MPKLGMEPIRKRQLIEATVASIHRNGFAAGADSFCKGPREDARAGADVGDDHARFQPDELDHLVNLQPGDPLRVLQMRNPFGCRARADLERIRRAA